MLDNPALATLLAVVEEGSFDAAARQLNVTPGAISQRIRNLEEQVGQILVRRTLPPEPTEAGKIVLRMAHQTRLLETETVAWLKDSYQTMDTRLTIAINEGSLATWFPKVMAFFLKRHRVMLDLRVGDHAQTNQMLRDGTAIAAVTSDPKPIQGCRSERIGELDIVAIADPRFRDHHFPDGLTPAALNQAPIVLCDRDDTWTGRFISTLTRKAITPPTHYVPTSRGAVEAVKLGLGWRAASATLVNDDLARGSLINLAPGKTLAMELHGQTFRIKSATLDALTEAVREGAIGRTK
jgi:LysR family transcriptional regulator (chromosome initiation inhibitor)